MAGWLKKQFFRDTEGENSYDENAEIAVMLSENILEEEAVLLKHAYANFPRIMIPKYDMLLVEEMGKDVSGAGMDTRIISRFTHDGIPKDPHQQIICCLRLTKETHGNANGMGLYPDSLNFQQVTTI